MVLHIEWTFAFHLDLQLTLVHATGFCSALIVHKLFVSKAVSLPYDLRKVKVNDHICLQSAAEHKGHANRTSAIISALQMGMPPSQSFLQYFC